LHVALVGPALVGLALVGLALVGLPSPAHAATPSEPINSVLGDASFAWRHGRLPTPADSEQLRIETHLGFVGQLLRMRAPADPRRAHLVDMLDDYAARGAFPHNTIVASRNPVFIDEAGAICAVGHLVEATAGRAPAEHIAAAHRLDRIVDMDDATLAAWVAQGPLSLRELAMIQPEYGRASDYAWGSWAAEPPAERGVGTGPAVLSSAAGTLDGHFLEGHFLNGEMHGEWLRRTEDGAITGYGLFSRGAGTWLSWAADGTLLAMGEYSQSVPDGEWRFWWPNGALSGEGRFAVGVRIGHWRHYDQRGVLIAEGPHAHAEVGKWIWYEAAGNRQVPVARADFDAGTFTWLAPSPGKVSRTNALWPCELALKPRASSDAFTVRAVASQPSAARLCEDLRIQLGSRLEYTEDPATVVTDLSVLAGLRAAPGPHALGRLKLTALGAGLWQGHVQVELASALANAELPDRFVCSYPERELTLDMPSGTVAWRCNDAGNVSNNRKSPSRFSGCGLIGQSNSWCRIARRHPERGIVTRTEWPGDD
jgi:hypothetical protein